MKREVFYVGTDAARAALVSDLFPNSFQLRFLNANNVLKNSAVISSASSALCLVDLLEADAQLSKLLSALHYALPEAQYVAVHLYRHEAELKRLTDIGFHAEIAITQLTNQLPALLQASAPAMAI